MMIPELPVPGPEKKALPNTSAAAGETPALPGNIASGHLNLNVGVNLPGLTAVVCNAWILFADGESRYQAARRERRLREWLARGPRLLWN